MYGIASQCWISETQAWARNLVKAEEIRGGDSGHDRVGDGGGDVRGGGEGNSNCGNIQSRCGHKRSRAARVLRVGESITSLSLSAGPVSFLTSLKKCVVSQAMDGHGQVGNKALWVDLIDACLYS